MERPAIDNLHDPTKPEVYYFDDATRERVLARSIKQVAEATPKPSAPTKPAVKKARKSG